MAQTPAKPVPVRRAVPAAKPGAAARPKPKAAAADQEPPLTAKQKAQLAQSAAVRKAMTPKPQPKEPLNPVYGLANFISGARRMLSMGDVAGAVDSAAGKR